MGSGLILLGIVGAWLVVLVPMALRKHDASNLGTVDRFHDAMRVLSRRDAKHEPAAEQVETEVDDEPAGRLAAVRAGLAARRDRAPLTPAARRRRLLITLVLLCLGTLAGGLLGPFWLLAPHLLVDLLLGAFVVHLRRTAVARAEREWRAGMQQRRAPAPRTVPAQVQAEVPERAPSRVPAQAQVPAQAAAAPVLRVPVHVAGVPDRMPPRPLPVGAPAEQPAARAEELPPARGAQGEAWSPVPVPTPTYLTAPAAPRRPENAAPLAADARGLAEAERELGIVDEGPELDEILDRRRAVNDW